MKKVQADLAEEYAAELRHYMAGAGEFALQRAYELGRRAMAERMGVLEMAAIHQASLAGILVNAARPEEAIRAAQRASNFFAECLSPFEMALRGFQEANISLRRNLEELLEAQEEMQRQNERLAAANRAVEAERRRYRELFDFAPDGYLVTGLDGRIQEANNAAAALLRARPADLPGVAFLDFVPPEERPPFLARVASLRAGEAGRAEDWEIKVQPREGPAFPVALVVAPALDAENRLAGLRWLLHDITRRKRDEEERAHLRIREQVARTEAEAARRLAFVAEATSLLAASLDYETTLASVARLAVPYLADSCFVYAAGEDDSVRQVAVVCANPESEARLSELAEQDVPARVGEVLKSGRPELVHDAAEIWRYVETRTSHGGARNSPVIAGVSPGARHEVKAGMATDAPQASEGPSAGHGAETNKEQRRLLREMGFRSAILVPLIARGRTLGVLAFVTAESGRRYGPVELSLAEELAGRCALAVDNARLYRQVIIERDKAERVSTAKDEFVAILSHELRNPLTPILGWARVFRNQQRVMEDPLLSRGIHSLERNAQTMARLVEDCLDLARISSRTISLSKELTELNEIAETSIETVSESVAAKGLRLEADLSPVPLWLMGDRTRLSQAIMNLLTNAIRYTDSGGVISVRLRQADSEAEIEVKDTGIGIAAEFLEHMFEPFRQGSSRWLTSESGLGLGLAIVQQVVQAHGGRALAESRGPGCGSTFRLRLPLTVLAEPAVAELRKAADKEPAIRTEPATLRVLMVEDSEDILTLMKMELEALGYSVFAAPDGETALDIAQREPLDLIISDIKIPGMDGYELIRRLRQIPALVHTPAIALTGFGMQKDIERTVASGYNAHLTKPVDPVHLSVLIQKLVVNP